MSKSGNKNLLRFKWATLMSALLIIHLSVPAKITIPESQIIQVPIPDKDGNIRYVPIDIKKDGQNGTLTIPGVGQVAVITNPNGEQDLTLTPETIKDTNNTTCSISLTNAKKTSCTMSPMLIVKGNTVYTADQASFEYEQGNQIARLKVESDKLLITNKDDQTQITKSSTDLGTAGISIIASGEKIGNESAGSIPGVTTTGPELKDATSLQIVASSSTLVHRVTNPKDSSDQKTKLEISSGVSASIIATQNDQGQLSLSSVGRLNGPIHYDSDPFSTEKVVADSSAGAGYQLSYVEQGDKNIGAFTISTDATDTNGEQSNLTVTDTTKPGVENQVTSKGATEIVVTEEFDPVTGDPIPGKTNFLIATDNLSAVSTEKGKQPQTIELVGTTISASGDIENKQGQVNLSAQKLDFNEPNSTNVGGLEGDVSAQAIIDGNNYVAEARADKAYFGNQGMEVRADGNIYINQSVGMTPEKKVDGQSIDRETFAMAQNIQIKDGDKTSRFTGGVSLYHADLADGSSVQSLKGSQGSITSGNTQLHFTNGASLQNKFDKDGNLTSASLTSAQASGSSKDLNFTMDNSSTSMRVSGQNENGIDVREYLHSSSKLTGSKSGDTVIFNGNTGQFVESENIKYGTMDFESAELNMKDSTVDGRVTLLDGSMIFYDEKRADGTSLKEGQVTGSSMNSNGEDYSITVTAIGDDGTPGKFKIYFLEDGPEKSVQIFGEDGQRVNLQGQDKDGNFSDILARTVQTYENDQFKQLLATELSGQMRDLSQTPDQDNIVQGFNVAKIAGFETKDGAVKSYHAEDFNFFQNNFTKSENTLLTGESASFTETNYMGTITRNFQAYKSKINYQSFDKQDLSTTAQIDVGSIISSEVNTPDGKKVSMIKVDDIDFMAMDYDQMMKVTGSLGSATSFNSDQVSVIDIQDLQNLKVESLDKDMEALFNGKQFLKVDQKDENGKVTSSYLLVRDFTGKIKSKEDKLSTKVDLNARVFEYVKDEVTGQNIILRADADFKAKARFDTGSIGSVTAKLHGGIKGENITTSSSSYESADGKVKGGTFNIHADSLQKLEFGAKVGFVDLIDFKAEGENGKSINYSYEIDKGEGVLKLRGVYKDGDKMETKFLFFKLKSHKEGNDAVQSLVMRLKGQSFTDHMAILSETASIRKVNDFLGVSDGGAITLTAGAGDKGFAMELMVVDEDFAFRSPDSYRTFHNPTNSYGLKLKYIKEDNSEWGVQAALTSDSRVEVDGDLYALGSKVDSFPTTANLNLTYQNAENDLSVVTGLNVPLTTYMVDEDQLNPDAQFFDNGRRKAAGPGAHVAVTKKYEQSELRVVAGMYDNFSSPAVHVQYQSSPQVLANLGRGIINIASGEPFEKGFKSTKSRSPSSYERQKKRQEAIRDREIQEMEAKRMVVLEKKIDELSKYYKGLQGFDKIKEILKQAKEYLNSPIDPQDTRKNIFRYSREDRAEFAFFESDKQKIEDIDNIILGITENRIMLHIPLHDHSARMSMLEIYRKRRYYDTIESMDLLQKINESGLDPCHYFKQQESL